ncbi:MAG: hypothetical protein QM820_11225 [Minicystis sp.]
MALIRMAWLVAAGVVLAIGCGDGGSGTTAGTGGGTTASSSSSAGGGSGGSTTTTTNSSTATGTGGGGPVYEPSGFSCSGANPSLANDIVPNITTPSCASKEGCHIAMHAAGGVIDQLVNRIAEQCLDSRLMVDPGNPEKSYAIHKLTNHNICTGQTMPKDAPLLPDADIQKIYDWICNGAPNN